MYMTKQKQTHQSRQQTSDSQWGEDGWVGKQDAGKGLRGTNY